MAAASCLLTEDQFLCSVCLDVFTDPVTLPCGHNFCKSCITEHWNLTVQCQCPVCKKIYNMRPELQVNTFISEMAAQFTQSAQHKSSSSEQHAAKPGEVPCDVCTGPELKALKSCLVCLTSYCETHLEPHLMKSGLKRHQLIDPVKNLEDRMCKKHDKLLELFCKSDQMCVCVLCPYSDHKTHDVVALKEECEGKRSELVKTEAEIQQMILSRRVKIEEMRRSVELSNKAADTEMAEGVQVLTALKETVERSQAELIKTITEKRRTTEKQAEDFITELEQEISDLKKRSSEVEQLSQSEDQLHLLQNFSSLITAPPDKDQRSIRITAPPYEMTKSRAVNQLEEKISEIIKQVLQDKLKRVQQFTVDVTLDPNIVHPRSDGQMVNDCRCVSSTEGFTSGRFYFESQVGRWHRWTLGVTTQTNIRGRKTLSPTNGFWTVSMKDDGGYSASSDTSSDLCLKSKPKKVGVFVDYEQGLVSFYDGDTAALIFSFNGCSFTGKLYPYFSPCPQEEFTEQMLCLNSDNESLILSEDLHWNTVKLLSSPKNTRHFFDDPEEEFTKQMLCLDSDDESLILPEDLHWETGKQKSIRKNNRYFRRDPEEEFTELRSQLLLPPPSFSSTQPVPKVLFGSRQPRTSRTIYKPDRRLFSKRVAPPACIQRGYIPPAAPITPAKEEEDKE